MIIHQIFNFIWSTEFLLSVSGIVLLWSFTKKNNNFFDIRKVFVDQIKIFNDAKGQVFIFYGIPMLMAFGIAEYKLIEPDIIDNIVIVLSIFISMLFAVLSILTNLNNDDEHYKKVLKETFNTVVFECVLCIIELIVSVAILFIGGISTVWIKYLFSVVVYYLMFTVFLNVFIIIKRMKRLFEYKK